ncbi:MAG: hypothetical protein ABR559_01075 [Gemmatimonadota bacterium]
MIRFHRSWLARAVRGALAAVGVLALAAATRPPAPVCAQRSSSPAGPIQIVLDASGSMRGRLGEEEKMSVAKEFLRALRQNLADGRAEPALGLRVFGAGSHRLRRDCGDTARLVGQRDPATAWTAALAGVQPLGVSPLALTLERAAADTATTYVLLADGTDTCGRDACAAWRSVVGHRGNRRARLHVVALNPDRDELERLRCLSRAGSGSFTVLTDPAGIDAAAQRLALVLQNRGLLDVRLRVGAGGEAVSLPVSLLRRLTREVVAVFTSRGPRPVPAGIYTVLVGTAPTLAIERVLILPGETAVIERVDLGRLVVDLRDASNAPVRAPLSVRSSRGGPEVRYLFTGDPAILQAGSYDLHVDHGDSFTVREDVVVTAGRLTRLELGGSGTLTILAPEFADPPLTRALLMHGETVDTLRVGETARVGAGRYRLTVQTLPVFVTESVVVTAGGAATVTLPPTGVLGLELIGPDGPVDGQRAEVREPLTGEVYGVLLSGERRLIMPGSFALELQTIPAQSLADVVVLPGEEQVIERRGLGRLTIVPPPGGGAWRLEVLAPAGGRKFGEATGSPPALLLWGGRYVARVWRGSEMLWEGPVTVAPEKTVRIDLDRL